MSDSAPYWPCYCEENVWHLCGPDLPAGACVLVVSNRARSVAFWHQKAARDGSGPVVWDYHVILALPGETGPLVVDPDTTLGPLVTLPAYVRQTFPPPLPPELAPRFRIVPAAVYRRELRTDRRHMRRPDGSFSAPPPPWPPIGQGSNLARFIDLEQEFWGEVVELERLGDQLRQTSSLSNSAS
jgi:hypothetical protein